MLVLDVAELLVPEVAELLVPEVAELDEPLEDELDEPLEDELDEPPRIGSLGACRPVANASAAVSVTPMTSAESTVTTLRNLVRVAPSMSVPPSFPHLAGLDLRGCYERPRSQDGPGRG